MSSNAPLANARQAATSTAKRRSLIGRVLARRLAKFDRGQIVFTLPNGEQVVQSGERDGARAHINVLRWKALLRLMLEGDVGLAAAFIDGEWSTEDLSSVLAFGIENDEAMTQSLDGSRLLHNFNRMRHGLRRNTRRGSKRNIAAHYDLGNEFYRLWLDQSMQYSSAIFADPNETLETAQARKLDRIVAMLEIDGGENVLEIGCGWGAVAERLAAQHDCAVTGLTLSREQAEFARQRLQAQGLDEKTSIELRDYRDVAETYDRIVSIEMFEAVGATYWPVYFDKLAQSLGRQGCAVLQIITIAEKYFDYYSKRPDFIQKYIFPGGMLPTKTILHDLTAKAGLRIAQQECFAASYKHTLDAWRKRFEASWRKVAPLGFDDRFRRMWEYYLHYCATGFGHGSIDVGLYKLVKT